MSYKKKRRRNLCAAILLLFCLVSMSFSLGAVDLLSEDNAPSEKMLLEDTPGLKNFEVDITEPGDGTEFSMGEDIKVEYMVENTGEESETQDVELIIFDEEREAVYGEEHEVTLQPEVEIEMHSTWTAETPGDYDIQVSCESDSDEVEIKVVAEKRAYFAVEITSYDQEVIEGHEVAIGYEVENRGTEEDTQDVEFDIYDEGGRSVFSRSERLRLSPGDNFTDEFSWETEENETGVFDLVLVSEDDFDEVRVTVLKGAYFEVSIYDYDEEVVEGDMISITYRVDNTGEVEGEQDIAFIVEGEVLKNETDVNIGVGGVYAGVFTWETSEEEVGERSLKVATDNHEAEISVAVLKDALFEVDIIDHDAEVKEDETVVVEYRVTNVGEVEGEQRIEFLVNGELEDSRVISLDGGESSTDEFSWSTDEAGEYDLTIYSEDDGDLVTVSVEEEGGIPGFTLPLFVTAMIIGVVIYYKKEL